MPMKLFDRVEPRQPVPWPYPGEDAQWAVGIAAVATVVLFLGVTGYQGSRYFDAGVREVFWVGAAAAHLLVVLLMLLAASLYRWGFPRRAVAGIAVLAAGEGVLFAVLPPVVAGLGWLTCLLAALFGLSLYLVFGMWVVLAARHLPMWWSGWTTRPAAPAKK